MLDRPLYRLLKSSLGKIRTALGARCGIPAHSPHRIAVRTRESSCGSHLRAVTRSRYYIITYGFCIQILIPQYYTKNRLPGRHFEVRRSVTSTLVPLVRKNAIFQHVVKQLARDFSHFVS